MSRRTKTYRWEFRDCQADKARNLREKYNLHQVVASVLANRGLALDHDELLGFMKPKLGALHDPLAMADMAVAIERTVAAVRKSEPIVVFGDYDADGMTSTALMMRLLQHVGANCSFYVPHRVDEGYGLNTPALEKLAAQGARLVITVDNGISGIEQVRRARELGVDVIVTDHHQASSDLPEALAVVNPNRLDCLYPCKHLTGVGVAFKFAHALLKALNYPPDESIDFLKSTLDLVAIGTIADFAPLAGENRVLVSHGLVQISQSTNMGIVALRDHLKLNSHIAASHVGFQIGPRLNAAGRCAHAELGVRLLLSRDADEARRIVAELENCNSNRRKVEAQIMGECMKFVEQQVNLNDEPIVVVDGKGWHLGVIGIVAARIMDEVGRPVVVLTHKTDCVKGSARSFGSFNLYEALTHCSEHLTVFGGHPHAAGMTLPIENVPAFRQAINAYALASGGVDDMIPPLVIDAEVDCQHLDMEMMTHLRYMEPFGQSNPHPVLASRGVVLNAQPRVVGDKHLKLQFAHDTGVVEAIGFNLGYMAQDLNQAVGARLDVVFSPSLSTYWSQPRVEMEVKDLRLVTS